MYKRQEIERISKIDVTEAEKTNQRKIETRKERTAKTNKIFKKATLELKATFRELNNNIWG